ncbi:unnamed protein product [Protopolystoma xenopodis]|uniref:Uncharacterized protein n=1 Tax=Protopolystoma xenopodis TaxID=117903 RepID=A0A3S5ATG1_9PLAT|nr:unnamed protein product [Protopolystoma xenopodis]
MEEPETEATLDEAEVDDFEDEDNELEQEDLYSEDVITSESWTDKVDSTETRTDTLSSETDEKTPVHHLRVDLSGQGLNCVPSTLFQREFNVDLGRL